MLTRDSQYSGSVPNIAPVTIQYIGSVPNIAPVTIQYIGSVPNIAPVTMLLGTPWSFVHDTTQISNFIINFESRHGNNAIKNVSEGRNNFPSLPKRSSYCSLSTSDNSVDNMKDIKNIKPGTGTPYLLLYFLFWLELFQNGSFKMVQILDDPFLSVLCKD